MNPAPFETFPLLESEKWLRHGFILRVPNLPINVDKAEALALLEDSHRAAICQIGLAEKTLITAEQVHGNRVVRVTSATPSPVLDCDGIITSDPAVALGIYTADCGAIYLADPINQAIGLLHSGKKGTELDILNVGINRMIAEFHSDPATLLVQLGPCIRPPDYEIDFASEIAAQASAAHVSCYQDCEFSTAADLEKYYSYRLEMGKTGRLLAVLGYSDHAG